MKNIYEQISKKKDEKRKGSIPLVQASQRIYHEKGEKNMRKIKAVLDFFTHRK